MPASAYGLPSVSVPTPSSGPPAGIAVIAPPGHDFGLLALAQVDGTSS
ncbi:hypothetical protein OHA72_60885 [Dactylosporangium sp. NBC_01737]|nr:hypothetical protein OHA72_60885 [Dactylosporangium sp. NBC_01737]